MTHAADATFARLIAHGLTLVRLHARRDRATARNRPAPEAVAKDRTLDLVLVNIDRCPEMAARFGIVGVPIFRQVKYKKIPVRSQITQAGLRAAVDRGFAGYARTLPSRSPKTPWLAA